MNPLEKIQRKITDWQTAKQRAEAWRETGQTLVFTNGCFDLLHFGHLHYLAEAKGLGDRLVVGLNSAESVARLKGQHRPINDDDTRTHLLAALEVVDMVVVFGEDTPLELIKLLQPDILVKGGDYKPQDIVGYDVMTQGGGEVRVLPFIADYSTSNIERKIRDSK